MPLEFASIARLWWAFLAIPIIVLFVLRVRLRRKPVATLLFWDQLFQEQPPRAWWQRLRNILALALQLAFLGLVVGALTDPLWSWQKQAARQIVYVIDNSASMSARDGKDEQTRLDKARATARRMIGSLRQLDTAAIITAGGQPRVAMGTTGDVQILQQAIDNILPSDNPTQLVAATELADRLFTKEQGCEIIVLTDGASTEISDLQNNDSVTIYGFSLPETGNVGITSFQVRRSITDATSYQILAEVTNFGDEDVKCRIEIELEGEVVDVIPLTLKPDEPWRQTLDHTSATGGRLIAKLGINDALKTDNQAIAVLPYRRPIPVHLVTPGSIFLHSVFESIPNVQLAMTSDIPESLAKNAILVVHKTKLENVPPGPVLVIDPQDDSDLWKVKGGIEHPIVASQIDSPLLAHIRLQNVLLPGAKSLDFTLESVPLIKSPLDTPMYSMLSRDSGDVLVLSTNLSDSDLPLRIAFPVMIKNAIESFLGDKGELRPAIRTGQITSVITTKEKSTATKMANDATTEDTAPVAPTETAASETLVLRAPDGRSETIDQKGNINIGPLDHAGLWLLGPQAAVHAEEPSLADETIVPVACNLANADESDLRPRANLDPAPITSAVWGGHSLWFYLALLAIMGISLEWFLYQRRIIA